MTSTTYTSTATFGSSRALPGGMLLADSEEELIRSVVGQLRERKNDLSQILNPLLKARNQNITTAKPESILQILYDADRLLLEILSRRYNELDQAVRNAAFALAEIDGEGFISYANAAFSALVPGAVAMNFAALFGPRAVDVERALDKGEKTSLRLDLSRGDQQPIQLRGEFGPLTDERGRRGAYALLLDVQAEEQRLNASPDAILRLDTRGVILFANRQAETLLGALRRELVGRPAKAFFSPRGLEASGSEVIEAWLRADGIKEEADALTRTGPPVPVRVSIMPWFDTVDRRCGTLLSVVPIAQELAGAELERLLTQRLEPEVLVQRVLRAVRGVVPYDLATFSIFTDRMRHQRTLVLEPPPERVWATRWFPVDNRSLEWLRAGQTWGDDLASTVREVAPAIEEDSAVQEILARGLQSFLTLPIWTGNDAFGATLTLLSTPERRYGDADLQRLRDLGVERALAIAEQLLRRRREKRLKSFKDELAKAPSMQRAAKILASGITSCFDWDYAAVFRVDRRGKQFRLFEQYSSARLPQLPLNFELPLDAGLLGVTLSEGKPRIVHDAAEEPPEHGYLRMIPERASAMAVPLRIGGRIEWIVVAASEQRNAFEGPDLRALQELVAECQYVLNQDWQETLNASLLDAEDQAVVVVDAGGVVRRANSRASRLFGRERSTLLDTALKDYGKGRQDQLRLSSPKPVNRAHIVLCIADGIYAPVLATQRDIKDDYNHRLWLFSDVREWNLRRELRYLEETVSEVAQNVRVPLLTAGSLIRGAVREIAGSTPDGYKDMLGSAISYLRKADITYERLAGALSAQKEPEQPGQLFDALQVLREEIGALPEEDLPCIELDEALLYRRFDVSGWPEGLGFAFRSLLDFLLLRRPVAGKVRVGGEDRPDEKRLGMRFRVTGAGALPQAHLAQAGLAVDESAAPDSDPIAQAELLARSNASLAPRSIEAVVRQHGGTFAATGGPGVPEFLITLPAAPAGS